MLGTLRSNFIATASKWPDRTMLYCGDRQYTYGGLNAEVNRLAHFLSGLGVRQGDVVGLLLHNCAEFAIGFLACQKLGAISSCLNFRLSAAALGHALHQEKQKALIFNAGLSATACEIMKSAEFCQFICVDGPIPAGAISFADSAGFPDTEPNSVTLRETDLCNIIHTSGTTGRPKGVAFTHETQIISAIQYCLEMGLDRGHVGMSLAPVVIGAATNFFVAYMFVGAAQVMTGEYEATKALRLAQKHKVTEAFAVPTQMYQLVEARRQLAELDIASLRLLRSGGSPLSRTLLNQVREILGCEVLNTYGTTESCTAITTCHTGFEPESKWESIGKPSYFQSVRVIPSRDDMEADPGETIAVPGEGQLINQGPQCAKEYYAMPDENLRARAGWQYARDVVRLDSDGYIYPVDRVDNVIISGGENVYPQEIEFFLSKHPLVADVAVCGVPDEKWGQTVKALIVRRQPHLTAQDIDRYCLESNELPRYKRPRLIEFVGALQRNILGKLDRAALSSMTRTDDKA